MPGEKLQFASQAGTSSPLIVGERGRSVARVPALQ